MQGLAVIVGNNGVESERLVEDGAEVAHVFELLE